MTPEFVAIANKALWEGTALTDEGTMGVFGNIRTVPMYLLALLCFAALC